MKKLKFETNWKTWGFFQKFKKLLLTRSIRAKHASIRVLGIEGLQTPSSFNIPIIINNDQY